MKNCSQRSFFQLVTQDNPATTTVGLTDGVASPMVGGIVSSWPEVVVGGCGLQTGVSFVEVVPLVVVRKEGDVVGSLVTGSAPVTGSDRSVGVVPVSREIVGAFPLLGSVTRADSGSSHVGPARVVSYSTLR